MRKSGGRKSNGPDLHQQRTNTEASLEISLQDHFQTFEDKCNRQIADGIKKGCKLIVEKLNKELKCVYKDMHCEIDRAMKTHVKEYHCGNPPQINLKLLDSEEISQFNFNETNNKQ